MATAEIFVFSPHLREKERERKKERKKETEGVLERLQMKIK